MALVSLSVVVPCYNEETRVPAFVRSFDEFLRLHGEKIFSLFENLEVVFINDGSRDNTEKLLAEAVLELSHKNVVARYESLLKNQGKGAAVRRGFQLSQGDVVLMTDVDLSTPLVDFFKLYETDGDLVLGSRAVKESRILKKQSRGRPQLGRYFNSFTRLLTGIPFLDTQCGFKLLKGDLARRLASQMTENRFAFDVELVLLANREGAQIREVGVEWTHQEPTRVVVWRDGIQMLMRVLVMAANYGRYR